MNFRLLTVMITLFLSGFLIKIFIEGFTVDTSIAFLSDLSTEIAGVSVTYLVISQLIDRKQREAEKREKAIEKQSKIERQQHYMIIDIRFGSDRRHKQVVIEKMKAEELFAGILIENCDLIDCNFQSIIFKSRDDIIENKKIKTRIISTNLSGSYFNNCEFLNIEFSNVNFSNSKFKNCRFRDCVLSMSAFTDVQFQDTIFSGGKIKGAGLNEKCDMRGISFINKVEFDNIQFDFVTFKNMNRLNINNTKYVKFLNCKLGNVWFENAYLSKVDFSGSIFHGKVIFERSICDETTIFPDGNKLCNTDYSIEEIFNKFLYK